MREYPLEPLRLRLFYAIAGVSAVIGLVLAAFFLWAVGTLGLDLLGLVIVALPVVLFGGIALAIVRSASAIRLELTDSGVTLHLPGARMSADWNDVQRIAPALWGPLSGDALRLTRPARADRAWWFAMFFNTYDERAIPLSPFALPLAGSRLEADLRSRLPELFDRDVSGSSSVLNS
jgi:hypothetical protein